LKQEARSVSKFKEISYKLENKVVELTQNLQTRTQERKALQGRVQELEQKVAQWTTRHEDADSRAKTLLASLQNAEAEISQREALLAAKVDVEKRLEEALAKAAEKEEQILKLTEDIIRQATQLEQQQKSLDVNPVRTSDDRSIIGALKQEVASLREALNRSNALSKLNGSSRADAPSSPTFQPVLRSDDHEVPGFSQHQQHQQHRRHNSAGVLSHDPQLQRTSTDELMYGTKKERDANPRAVSMAFNGEDNFFRRQTGISDVRDYEDAAEEKIWLMQDGKRLDEDILEGLVKGLKIPAPNLTSISAVKEILFPSNLISLVINEMWKYGLIPESERFLANVMQTVQAHVMVRTYSLYSDRLTEIAL